MLAKLSDHCRGIDGIPIQKVIMRDTCSPHQLFHQHLAEAAGMCNRQTDIFIQMKGFKLGPVDAWGFCQRIQKLELRCGGGPHYASLPSLLSCAADSPPALLRPHAAPPRPLLTPFTHA